MFNPRAQVDGLLKAGVPSVIATAREIDDSKARLFAESFYAGLASGANLRAAFEAAKYDLTADHGADPDSFRSGERRDLGVESREEVSDVEGFPWDLYHRTEADQVLRWNLFLDDPLYGLPDLPDDILPPPSRSGGCFGSNASTLSSSSGAEDKSGNCMTCSPLPRHTPWCSTTGRRGWQVVDPGGGAAAAPGARLQGDRLAARSRPRSAGHPPGGANE